MLEMSALAALPLVVLTVVVALVVKDIIRCMTSSLNSIPGPKAPRTLSGFLFGQFPEIMRCPPITPHLAWATEFGTSPPCCCLMRLHVV